MNVSSESTITITLSSDECRILRNLLDSNLVQKVLSPVCALEIYRLKQQIDDARAKDK